MSTKNHSFWSRIGESFRKRPTNGHTVTQLPPVGEDGLLLEPVDGEDHEASPERSSLTLPRWTKRDATLAKLQEGYEKITQVVEDVQRHLATQGERSERMCNSMEQLARAVSDLPGVARQQAGTLESIARQLERTTEGTQKLAEVVGDLPRTARLQSDAMTSIGRRLEMANEQSVMASQTMDKLGSAISTLGQSGNTQAEVMTRMHEKIAAQDEMLARLVSRQSRRFTMLFVVTVVLAAAAVTFGVIGLVLRG